VQAAQSGSILGSAGYGKMLDLLLKSSCDLYSGTVQLDCAWLGGEQKAYYALKMGQKDDFEK
jgi:hypothetical protein